jgi:hypothetical protein
VRSRSCEAHTCNIAVSYFLFWLAAGATQAKIKNNRCILLTVVNYKKIVTIWYLYLSETNKKITKICEKVSYAKQLQ